MRSNSIGGGRGIREAELVPLAYPALARSIEGRGGLGGGQGSLSYAGGDYQFPRGGNLFFSLALAAPPFLLIPAGRRGIRGGEGG